MRVAGFILSQPRHNMALNISPEPVAQDVISLMEACSLPVVSAHLAQCRARGYSDHLPIRKPLPRLLGTLIHAGCNCRLTLQSARSAKRHRWVRIMRAMIGATIFCPGFCIGFHYFQVFVMLLPLQIPPVALKLDCTKACTRCQIL